MRELDFNHANIQICQNIIIQDEVVFFVRAVFLQCLYVVLSDLERSSKRKFMIFALSVKSQVTLRTTHTQATRSLGKLCIFCLVYFETFGLYEKTIDFKDTEGSPFCNR
jgi:hypothetical protein